jgi:hypothetical protein
MYDCILYFLFFVLCFVDKKWSLVVLLRGLLQPQAIGYLAVHQQHPF